MPAALHRQMLVSSKSPGATGGHTVMTDGCVRSASDNIVRTRNSGENEANFFPSPNSPKNQFAEKCTSRHENVSADIKV
jgi:hypothetical protein